MAPAESTQTRWRGAPQVPVSTPRVPRPSTEELVRRYVIAKRQVVTAGFYAEIAWQHDAHVSSVTDRSFLRESAWVVLSAGMRESIIRRRFPLLAYALHDFRPCAIEHDSLARSAALQAFNHERKVDAILYIARVAYRLGTRGLRRVLERDPSSLIDSLPFMGPATSRHLAKNLGLGVVKPDRHLLRLASAAARAHPDDLCGEIARWIDDPIAVVDLVLWRWATLHRATCSVKRCDGLPHP